MDAFRAIAPLVGKLQPQSLRYRSDRNDPHNSLRRTSAVETERYWKDGQIGRQSVLCSVQSNRRERTSYG